MHGFTMGLNTKGNIYQFTLFDTYYLSFVRKYYWQNWFTKSSPGPRIHHDFCSLSKVDIQGDYFLSRRDNFCKIRSRRFFLRSNHSIFFPQLTSEEKRTRKKRSHSTERRRSHIGPKLDSQIFLFKQKPRVNPTTSDLTTTTQSLQ
jgi:hypothetical protein